MWWMRLWKWKEEMDDPGLCVPIMKLEGVVMEDLTTCVHVRREE